MADELRPVFSIGIKRLLAVVCIGSTLTLSDAAQSAFGHAQPHYTPAATTSCLVRHGNQVERVRAETWLKPRPLAKFRWAAVGRIPAPVFQTGTGTVTLLFYDTPIEATAAARAWGNESRRALCAGYGPRAEWCLEHVYRQVKIPQIVARNVFVNFNGLYGATPSQQRRVSSELRACASR